MGGRSGVGGAAIVVLTLIAAGAAVLALVGFSSTPQEKGAQAAAPAAAPLTALQQQFVTVVKRVMPTAEGRARSRVATAPASSQFPSCSSQRANQAVA